MCLTLCKWRATTNRSEVSGAHVIRHYFLYLGHGKLEKFILAFHNFPIIWYVSVYIKNILDQIFLNDSLNEPSHNGQLWIRLHRLRCMFKERRLWKVVQETLLCLCVMSKIYKYKWVYLYFNINLSYFWNSINIPTLRNPLIPTLQIENCWFSISCATTVVDTLSLNLTKTVKSAHKEYKDLFT